LLTGRTIKKQPAADELLASGDNKADTLIFHKRVGFWPLLADRDSDLRFPIQRQVVVFCSRA